MRIPHHAGVRQNQREEKIFLLTTEITEFNFLFSFRALRVLRGNNVLPPNSLIPGQIQFLTLQIAMLQLQIVI